MKIKDLFYDSNGKLLRFIIITCRMVLQMISWQNENSMMVQDLSQKVN